MSADRTPTNIRNLLILEVLSQSDKALTATQMNESLGLPKQSIHRLCGGLEKMGFLVREERGKGLRPSRRCRLLASGLLNTGHLHIMRRQILRKVADFTQETVNFVQVEPDGMKYQDRVETRWPFRIQLPIGVHVPFHCTASGKVFLASLPAKKRQQMVQAIRLEGLTKNTHTQADTLLAELRRVRKQGFAVDNQEFMDGMVALAVPVYDPAGRFAAALATHGPKDRLDISAPSFLNDALFTGAKALQEILFASNDA